ncbi:class I SAM-dependent methyltransferase [Pedobacter psychrophilus]|nr:class I SAM-dependent methyltransferase [Pedobacter psychrophilus]
MNKETHCPLCNSNQLKFNFIENGHHLVSCLNCDLHFINPYKQNEINRNPLSSERQNQSEELAVKYYLPFISKYISNQDSVLDIGCGCGVLLKKCKELGVRNLTGLENDKDRAAFAKKNTECNIIESEINDSEIKEKFSVITLINVISHLPDLNAFFIKINEMLNENGKLIIKTGLMKNGFGKKNWYDWQIPEHIQFLGEHTPEYFAKSFNLKLVEKILIPLSEDLFSIEYLKSQGRYRNINFMKSILASLPIAVKLLKSFYNLKTGNKLFTTILVFEKAK